MTRRKAKTIRRRHLAFVLVLFAAVGALVIMANLRQPITLVVDEPQDVTLKRADTQNNAYYVLAEAAEMLPPNPPPLKLKDENGWEYFYIPENGSFGQALNIRRPDDDPIFLQYLDNVLPALDRAVDAFDKPYFLYPPHSFNAADSKQRKEEQDKLLKLAELYFIQARIRPCSEDPHQDACTFLHNTARLTCLLRVDGPAGFVGVEDTPEIIQNASVPHQAIIAAWLKQLRAEWKTPLTEIDRHIRGIYAISPSTESEKEIWPARVYWKARAARLKTAMYRNEAHIRKISCMNNREYEQFLLENPKLRDTPFAADFYLFRATKTYFFATADGLLLVLALEQFHRDNGVYPESLSELAPQYVTQLPENPFRPEPYAYAKRGADYSLCCPRDPSDGPGSHDLIIHEPDARS